MCFTVRPNYLFHVKNFSKRIPCCTFCIHSVRNNLVVRRKGKMSHPLTNLAWQKLVERVFGGRFGILKRKKTKTFFALDGDGLTCQKSSWMDQRHAVVSDLFKVGRRTHVNDMCVLAKEKRRTEHGGHDHLQGEVVQGNRTDVGSNKGPASISYQGGSTEKEGIVDGKPWKPSKHQVQVREPRLTLQYLSSIPHVKLKYWQWGHMPRRKRWSLCSGYTPGRVWWSLN